MKHILLATAVVLALAYAGILASFPGAGDGPPRLYWVTDPAPAREEQMLGFERWLVDQGHVTSDGQPVAEIDLDANNGDQSKLIIQGVSGVAGDLLDVRWGRQMRLFQRIGILDDVTEAAAQGAFGPESTWPAMRPEIMLHRRQYMFPANVAVRLLWVNLDAFERYGIDPPPRRWSFDAFESIGKRFVAAANEPGERQTVFFADDVPIEPMHRSLGLSIFNETMTASDLDDPRYIRVLELKHRWTYRDNILPTPGQQQSMQGQAGWGGAGPQSFVRGDYGMLYSGRYMVMQYRRMDAPRLDVSELPHGGFPNHRTTTRSTAVYAGSERPELARLFLAYLASERYNRLIVESGDAMPPIPKYTRTEAFRRPEGHRNEWGCHEVFAQAMRTTAIGGVYSEFILQTVADRIIERWQDEFSNGLTTAERAAAMTARAIDQRIERNLKRDASLRELYQQRLEKQAQIDDRLAAGKPIPPDWIANPFYRRYYEARGMLDRESNGTKGEAIPRDSTRTGSAQ